MRLVRLLGNEACDGGGLPLNDTMSIFSTLEVHRNHVLATSSGLLICPVKKPLPSGLYYRQKCSTKLNDGACDSEYAATATPSSSAVAMTGTTVY